MSTPTIPVRPVSVPAVLLGPETAREHIANAIQLLETLPVGSLGARDLQLFDYEAFRVRLRCALVWLDNAHRRGAHPDEAQMSRWLEEDR